MSCLARIFERDGVELDSLDSILTQFSGAASASSESFRANWASGAGSLITKRGRTKQQYLNFLQGVQPAQNPLESAPHFNSFWEAADGFCTGVVVPPTAAAAAEVSKMRRRMFEVVLGSSGILQIGFTTDSIIYTRDMGVGDFKDTYAYDGERVKKWGNGESAHYGEEWCPGDVIGACIDLDARTISFFRNGRPLGIAFSGIDPDKFYLPGISASRGEKAILNDGMFPFFFPISGYSPFHGDFPLDVYDYAKYLERCLTGLMLHSTKGCPEGMCGLGEDEVAIAAAQILDSFGALLVSPRIIASVLCPFIVRLEKEGGQAATDRFFELLEACMDGSQRVLEGALSYASLVWRSSSVFMFLENDPAMEARGYAPPLKPSAAIKLASILLRRPCLHKSENIRDLLELLFATKELTNLDRELLYPLATSYANEDMELSEVDLNRVRTVEAAIGKQEEEHAEILRTLEEAGILRPWLRYLLAKNKDYTKAIKPPGLTDLSVLTSVFFSLLQVIEPLLKRPVSTFPSAILAEREGPLADVPRLGGTITHLIKEVPIDLSSIEKPITPEDELFHLFIRLYPISIAERMSQTAQDFAMQARLKAILDETSARLNTADHLTSMALQITKAKQLADFLIIRRSCLWHSNRLLSREKMSKLSQGSSYVCQLLMEISKQGDILSYIPESFSEVVMDSFHTLRQLGHAIVDSEFAGNFVTYIVTMVSDDRIKSPDTKDNLLRSIGILTETGTFLPLFAGKEHLLMKNLLSMFNQKYLLAVARILLNFWAGIPFGSLRAEIKCEAFRHAFRRIVSDDSALLNGILNLVLNTSNSTLSELLVALQEFKAIRERHAVQDIEQTLRKVLSLFDLSVALLRIVEIFTMELPSTIFADELICIRVTELTVFCLTRFGEGKEAYEFLTESNFIAKNLSGRIHQALILAPVAGILLQAAESPLSQTVAQMLFRTASNPERFDILAAIQWREQLHQFTRTPQLNGITALQDYIRMIKEEGQKAHTPEPTKVDLASEETEDGMCAICCAFPIDTQFEPCGHESCHVCIQRHLANDKTCFFCKAVITNLQKKEAKY